MSDRIDHEYTREVVCPHCGYEHGDSWERHMDDGAEESDTCGRCGKDFTVTCCISVTYSTEKKEAEELPEGPK